MKKILSVIALIMALSLTMACFASCDLFKKPEEEKDQVTVSWYQGSKLLREEKIDKGSKVTSWTPEAEGKTFTGWVHLGFSITKLSRWFLLLPITSSCRRRQFSFRAYSWDLGALRDG